MTSRDQRGSRDGRTVGEILGFRPAHDAPRPGSEHDVHDEPHDGNGHKDTQGATVEDSTNLDAPDCSERKGDRADNEEHKLRNGVPDGGHSNLRERVDEEQVLAGKERLNDDHHTDDNWTIEHDNGSHDAEEARLQGAW